MSRKIFIITSIFSFMVIAVSGILLVRREVQSFTLFGSYNNDCTPYNVFVSRGTTEYSAEISWYTKGKCVGFIQYGKDKNNLEMIAVDLLNMSKSNKHNVVLEKLVTSEPYYYLINSGGKTYGNSNIPLDFVLGQL